MEENTSPSVRRKYLTPVDIDMTPYHQLQPVPPDKMMKTKQNKNMIKEGGSLWILLRRQKTYNTDNEEQTIPEWTGFYHEVKNASEELICEIHDLPAINASPTKYNTVQEILLK